MKYTEVVLLPLAEDDREAFILDNQYAFKYGAKIDEAEMESMEVEDGQIISRQTIESSIDAEGAETYRIFADGRKVGGAVLKIDRDTGHNHLDLLYVLPDAHGKGIGYGAWKAIEALYPDTKVWETCTPYADKRNIHFYVNKCGFQIVEFFHELHFYSEKEECDDFPDDGPDELFRFIKKMK